MILEHFDVLKCSYEKEAQESWKGRAAVEFEEYCSPTPPRTSTGWNHRLSRHELRQLCQDPDNAAASVYVAVMAWGGQRPQHFKSSWKCRGEIANRIDKLRALNVPEVGRQQAFDLFAAAAPIRGLGAAFYTKLLFFCGRSPTCWIMDQWTSKSINLLFGRRVVPIYGDAIPRTVNGRDYDDFCRCVDQVASQLGCSGADAEMALFSRGGHLPSIWRAYVKGKGQVRRTSVAGYSQ